MGTFGKTTVGGSLEVMANGYQQVSMFALGSDQSITKLTVSVDGLGSGAGASQVFKGVIFSDVAGAPTTLLGTSNEVTVLDNDALAWVDTPFAVAVALTTGNYWLGFHAGTSDQMIRFGWSTVTNNRHYKARAYASGPLTPFGAPTGFDNKQIDVYATWVDAGGAPVFNPKPLAHLLAR